MAKTITIYRDGTYTPVTVMNGEDISLNVAEYEQGTDECEIEFKIRFRRKSGNVTTKMDFTPTATARTIKIGS